jgi:inosine/xanthosine triphosphatase
MHLNTRKKEHGTCSFGVGIEAGMFNVPEVETKYMDSSICAIYDGKRYYIGFSPSFEYPQTVVDRTLQGEEIGYMEDVFGNTAKGRKGAIGVLTNGRVYRDELEEYAVIMALTKIVSKEIYEK